QRQRVAEIPISLPLAVAVGGRRGVRRRFPEVVGHVIRQGAQVEQRECVFGKAFGRSLAGRRFSPVRCTAVGGAGRPQPTRLGPGFVARRDELQADEQVVGNPRLMGPVRRRGRGRRGQGGLGGNHLHLDQLVGQLIQLVLLLLVGRINLGGGLAEV